MLDNKVLSMTPGEALLDVPVGDFIQRLGVGIAEAQLRLDQMAVRVAAMLSDARVEMRDAKGKVTTKSLLELGFTPTFYHFTETELEVRMTLSIKVEEGFNFGFSANVGNDAASIQAASQNANAGAEAAQNGQGGGGNGGGGGGQAGNASGNSGNSGAQSSGGDRRAVAFGAAINVEYHRKYGFEMTGSSMVRTKMISVPPPAPFLEALREQARAGGSIGAGSAGGNNNGNADNGNSTPAPADDDDDDTPAPTPAPDPDAPEPGTP